ncbi:MAG TPA: geranylgeranylglycerol-phosphate geranylgeranyltransferase [Gemmatimonadales bacterium]|nr:geranylgeranylglycerol-phosphate geranylgeranyltransferase [Gemmatimonadales bacterium]
MIAVLRLVRAQNLLVAAVGVLAGGWIALRGITTPTVLALAALAAVGFGAAGNTLNDIWDGTADRVNRPGQRPLATGRVARGTADLCVAGGTFLGFAAAALVDGTAVLVGAAALAVMVAYSPVLKRRGLPGNVAVALVAGLPLMYGAIAVGRPEAGMVPWTLAAWIHLVREVVKDLDDEAGDRALGRRTLPILLGQRRAGLIAGVLAAAFVPLSLALPAATHYGGAYFVIALFAQLMVLAVAGRLFAGRNAGNSGWLKGAMLLGIVALVAGRVA